MIHLKGNLNTLHQETCIKVYDPELKKLIGIYPNYLKAANKLGISSSAVQQRCTRKTRVYSPTYGKDVACRLSSVSIEEITLMDACKNKFL
jgi:hypothetical protein